MRVPIRQIGRARWVLIPEDMAAPLKLEQSMEIQLKGRVLVLRKACAAPRAGWAEAAKRIAASGDDKLVMGEFANDPDGVSPW